MRARVVITLRTGVLDPAGEAVRSSLSGLGFDGVASVRLGKVVDLELGDVPEDVARQKAEEMARALLANPVTEDFTVHLE